MLVIGFYFHIQVQVLFEHWLEWGWLVGDDHELYFLIVLPFDLHVESPHDAPENPVLALFPPVEALPIQ